MRAVLALPIVLALLLLAASAALPAQDAGTIYRCTSANGEVTIQNGVRCPAGSRQEVRKVEALPSRPPPAPAAAPAETVLRPPPATKFVQVAAPLEDARGQPVRPEVPRAARLADSDRLPPPPIFRCETWDKDSYLSEDPAPKPRCVRLDTSGVGEACEMKYDVCARVGDNAACAGWKRRQGEIESGWRHARGGDKAALQEEFARVTRILQDTTCGV